MMTGCDVCIVGNLDVGEDNAFHHEQQLRARKPHTCCECRRTIAPGEVYERVTGCSDGTVWRFKTCAPCAEVRRLFYCDGGWYYGCLWDEMAEQAFPRLTTASPCFRELSPAGKAHVLEQWNRWRFGRVATTTTPVVDSSSGADVG